jgi:ABC-type tungstate transport system substrate-binding protein
MKKFKNKFRYFVPLAIVFLICDMILYRFNIDIGKINDNDFIFIFTGVLLGFALTIFPFIVTLVDKIREKSEKRFADNAIKKQNVEIRIAQLYSEVKDNIVFIFLSLSIVGFVYILQNIEVKAVLDTLERMFAKSIAYKALRLSIFLLNIYAIYDLIAVSFKLSDTTGIINSVKE